MTYYRPNRPRVYDAEELARNMRESFQDAPSARRLKYKWEGWPAVMQQVGDSLAIGYSSDKWEEDWEDYKHLAESPNRAYLVEDLLYHEDDPSSRVETIGPLISFEDVPMPKHFAQLGIFLLSDLQLYTQGDDDDPRVGRGNAGVVEITLKHAWLGGSYIRWSEVSSQKDQPFIFVYTESRGPLMLVLGDELDIIKDGIVG